MENTLNVEIKKLKSELEQAVATCAERLQEEELELQNYQLKIMGLELGIGGHIFLNNVIYTIKEIKSPDKRDKTIGIDNWSIKLKCEIEDIGEYCNNMPTEIDMEVE